MHRRARGRAGARLSSADGLPQVRLLRRVMKLKYRNNWDIQVPPCTPRASPRTSSLLQLARGAPLSRDPQSAGALGLPPPTPLPVLTGHVSALAPY